MLDLLCGAHDKITLVEHIPGKSHDIWLDTNIQFITHTILLLLTSFLSNPGVTPS